MREREGGGSPQRLWISLFIKTPCPHAHKSLIIICYQRCLPNCTERLRDRFFRIGTQVRWSLKAGDKMNKLYLTAREKLSIHRVFLHPVLAHERLILLILCKHIYIFEICTKTVQDIKFISLMQISRKTTATKRKENV